MFRARAAAPAFSAKPCGGRVPMRLVLGPGRWSCDRGGWFSGPPGGACSMGRGGRRSRGNPKGVPLARFGRGKFSTASAGQLSAKRYRKNLKAKTYRFRGGAIRRGAPRAARLAAASFSPSPAKGGAVWRQDGARLGRSGRWPLAASPVGSEREGASLEGRPGFRVSEKAPRGRASWRQKRAGQTSRLSPSPLVRNRRR